MWSKTKGFLLGTRHCYHDFSIGRGIGRRVGEHIWEVHVEFVSAEAGRPDEIEAC